MEKPRLTRADARLIAQELHLLLRKDIDRAVHAQIDKASDEYIGTAEAAAMLGCKPKTIYNHRDRLPHSKVGKYLRFSRNALHEMIRQGFSLNGA